MILETAISERVRYNYDFGDPKPHIQPQKQSVLRTGSSILRMIIPHAASSVYTLYLLWGGNIHLDNK